MTTHHPLNKLRQHVTGSIERGESKAIAGLPVRPQVGQTFTAYGEACEIVKVHKFGTIDIVSPSGKAFRVTGLGFI